MPHKVLINVFSVWLVYAIAGLINLTLDEWIGIISFLKEFFGLLAFLFAAGFTLYKFRREWRGWNPTKKKRSKDQEEE